MIPRKTTYGVSGRALLRATVGSSLVGLTCLLLAACGSTSSSSASSSKSVSSSSSARSQGQLTIGYAVPVIANPYWESNVMFAQEIAKQLGVKLDVANADSSEQTQLSNVESLVSEGAKGIVFGPIDSAIGPTILRVCSQNHLMCAGMARKPGPTPNASNEKYYVGYVVGNDYQDGYYSMKQLIKAGATKVVAMTGTPGNSVADDRLAGALAAAKAAGVQVLATNHTVEVPAEGQSVMEAWIAAYPGPKFNGVWSFNDDSAVGAIRALQAANLLSKVKVAADDGTQEGVNALLKGQLAATGSGGEFIDGGLALVAVFDALKGVTPAARTVELNGVQVTPSIAAQYQSEYLAHPPTYNAKQISRYYNPQATASLYKVAFPNP